jgi:hypothetical protein
VLIILLNMLNALVIFIGTEDPAPRSHLTTHRLI